MPKLILSMDGLVLKEILLRQERLSIGRKPDNDIQIDNLAISGHHAVITTILGDAFLEDQNSTNGTYVNGQQIKKHVLRNNDVIELGKYRLKYLGDVGLADPVRAQDAEVAVPGGVTVNIAAAATGAGPEVAAPAAQGLGQQVGVLLLLNGGNAGREVELAKAVTTLGRPGKQVAVLARRQHGYFITHVEGDAFPLVNGRAIDAQPHRIEDGDVLDIAGTMMKFLLRG